MQCCEGARGRERNGGVFAAAADAETDADEDEYEDYAADGGAGAYDCG